MPPPDPNLNTSAHLQILGLGTDAGDAVPSALLFFDRRRILFNVGEGFQRYATEHGHRLARVSDVLLTRVTPDAAGGLPGLCLTLADGGGGGGGAAGAGAAGLGGSGPIRVVGPPGLAALAAALRTFVDTRVAVIAPEEVGGAEAAGGGGPSGSSAAGGGRAVLLPPVVEDGVVTITPLLVVPPPPPGGGEGGPGEEDDGGGDSGDGGDGDENDADADADAGAGGSGADDAEEAAAHGGGGAGRRSSPAPTPAAKRARMDGSSPPTTSAAAEAADPTTLALAYVCALAPIPGKFLPAKAIAAGVKPGPLFGALKAGKAVQAGDGTWVQPGEVMEAGTPGPVAIVLDAPSRGHASALASSATAPGGALARWAVGGPDAGNLAAVIHLSHADVVATPEYERLAAALGCGQAGGAAPAAAAAAAAPAAAAAAAVDHLFVNEAATGGEGVMRASATLAARLNVLAPDLFPLHRVGVAAAYGGEGGEGGEGGGAPAPASTPSPPPPPPPPPSGLLPGGTPGRNLLRCHLRPLSKAGLDAGSVAPALDVGAIQADLRAEHGAALAAAAAAWQGGGGGGDGGGGASAPPPHRGAIQVVFLGTGAAQPSKYRNVSGTYVRLAAAPPASPGAASAAAPTGLLLDCGEGTLGQLRRRYGAAGAAAALAGLGAVWISHIHADHHAGLPGLLLARAAAVERKKKEEEGGGGGGAGTTPPAPLLVLGPRPMRRVLAAYARLYALHYHFVDCADVESGVGGGPAAGADADVVGALLDRAGLARLATVRVDHCAHAFGLVLDVKGGGAGGDGGGGDGGGAGKPTRLAFSGDTRAPCAALVAAAAGADLLVHEATFEDDLACEAAAKNHSTTSGAVGVGAAAGAAVTLLTHFSQRYPKAPVVAPDLAAGVGLAFDLMSLDFVDAGRVPALVQPIRVLFEGMEAKVAAEEKDGGGG